MVIDSTTLLTAAPLAIAGIGYIVRVERKLNGKAELARRLDKIQHTQDEHGTKLAGISEDVAGLKAIITRQL